MARVYVSFPVEEEHKAFCDYMEYNLESEVSGCAIYKIPHNHICRFLINYEKWKAGVFNKEEFIKQTTI